MKNRAIQIYDKKYSLKYIGSVDASGSWGQSNYQHKSIEILNTLPEEDQKTTIIHEIAHMIMIESGIHSMFTPTQRETICNICATTYSVAIRNKI